MQQSQEDNAADGGAIPEEENQVKEKIEGQKLQTPKNFHSNRKLSNQVEII
jgi:hypothetical protein